MDSLDAFEKEAEEFYRDTGFLAPGKSEAAAAVGQTDFERYEVRQLMKQAWNAGRKRGQLDIVNALKEPAPAPSAAEGNHVCEGYIGLADTGEVWCKCGNLTKPAASGEAGAADVCPSCKQLRVYHVGGVLCQK